MKDRKAINFYRSYYDVAKKIPKEDREPFLMAILDMQFEGIEPKEGELSLMSDLAFTSQKHSLVKQLNGYLNSKKPPTLKVTPKVTHTHTPPANCLPLTPDQEEEEVQGEEEEEELKKDKTKKEILFEEFWGLYGKKENTKKCKDKFLKLSYKSIDDILKVVEIYVKSTPDKKYRKNPYGWLNDERWKDEILQSKLNESGSTNQTVIKKFGKTNQI